jgi:hypothetical protein
MKLTSGLIRDDKPAAGEANSTTRGRGLGTAFIRSLTQWYLRLARKLPIRSFLHDNIRRAGASGAKCGHRDNCRVATHFFLLPETH